MATPNRQGIVSMTVERSGGGSMHVAFACIAMLVSATQAQAQSKALFWDWGGEKKVDGKGREMVRMAAAKAPGDIIVSFGDRKLYFVTSPGEALSYPIAVPREQSRWQGTIAVTSKRENPTWTPTYEMRTENPKLPSWVPGGHPMNPLGIRALYLGSSTYRIHGTDAPWTIGSAVSKGCVRMYNQDVVDLYPRVRVGTSVLVTWDKFEATADPDAKVPAIADAADQRASGRSAEHRSMPRSTQLKTGSLPPPHGAGASPGPSTKPRDDGSQQAAASSAVRKRSAPPPVVKKYTPPEELSI
jgi:lipoprotein-anchoring transpeptidase ErfK/SrfK